MSRSVAAPLVALLSLAGPAFPASAQQVVTACGAAYGWRYQISPGDPGWVKDGIDGGTVTLIQDGKGEFDVIVKDRASTSSLREDQARVIAIRPSTSATGITIVALYPSGDAETMQFTLDARGQGELLWSMMKPSSGLMRIKSGTLLKSDCNK